MNINYLSFYNILWKRVNRIGKMVLSTTSL
jgi:hypothetical protein